MSWSLYLFTWLLLVSSELSNVAVRLLLCLNSGSASSEEHLKAKYVTMLHKGCPNLKAPPDAAHKCSFFSLFLQDAPILFFMHSHILRFFACPKMKIEWEKMVTLRGVDCQFRGPGHQKSWRKGKTSGDATRKLTTSPWRTRLRRLQRPGP